MRQQRKAAPRRAHGGRADPVHGRYRAEVRAPGDTTSDPAPSPGSRRSRHDAYAPVALLTNP